MYLIHLSLEMNQWDPSVKLFCPFSLDSFEVLSFLSHLKVLILSLYFYLSTSRRSWLLSPLILESLESRVLKVRSFLSRTVLIQDSQESLEVSWVMSLYSFESRLFWLKSLLSHKTLESSIVWVMSLLSLSLVSWAFSRSQSHESLDLEDILVWLLKMGLYP